LVFAAARRYQREATCLAFFLKIFLHKVETNFAQIDNF